jgi:hypothetical protein
MNFKNFMDAPDIRNYREVASIYACYKASYYSVGQGIRFYMYSWWE